MIVQLQPEQIAGFWEVIRYSVIEVNEIPEELQQDYAIKVLERLLSGKLQCWVGFTSDERGRHINVVYTTSILGKDAHGFRILVIESAYGLRLIPTEMYEEALNKLKEFAKVTECKAVVAQTGDKRIKEMLLANGFEQQYTIYKIFI